MKMGSKGSSRQPSGQNKERFGAEMRSIMEYALEIRHLCKYYDKFRLEDVNLKLPKGSIIGLIGENGAGKSTTMKAALNLIRKDGGDVLFWGQELTEDSKELKEDIGVVFDGINFYETLTTVEVGNIHKAAYKNWDEEAYRDYCSRFNLPQDKEIREFSKGMQVKLCLAAALSHKAKLLILDEPTSGLDPVVRDDILDVFLDYVQDEENSILISSHITTDLEKIADYIVFINKGKIILDESKDELIYRYGIIRCGADDRSRIDSGDVLACRKSGYQWNVLVKDRKAAQNRYPGMIVDAATLEEIMLLYVKGETLL